MTTAAEILAAARATDETNTGIVLLLSSDPELERLVAVWTNVPVPEDPDPAEECPPDLPASVQLRWVWSRLEPDPIPVWIALSGLPDAPHVRRACALAIDNRVVLPDGSLSAWASVYLRQQARKAGIRVPIASVPPPASTPSATPPPPGEFPPPDAWPIEQAPGTSTTASARPEPIEMPEGMMRPRRRLRPPPGGA